MNINKLKDLIQNSGLKVQKLVSCEVSRFFVLDIIKV